MVLKVNDTVIIEDGLNLRKIGVVTEITKGGYARVNNVLYNSETGKIRGADAWSKSCIYKASPEMIQSVKDDYIIERAYRRMLKVKRSEMTLDKANMILDLFGDGSE